MANSTNGFDVFLCYNSRDAEEVEAIATQLLAHNLHPWFDKWELIPGESAQDAIQSALASCAHCAVFIGPAGSGPWQIEELPRLEFQMDDVSFNEGSRSSVSELSQEVLSRRKSAALATFTKTSFVVDFC